MSGLLQPEGIEFPDTKSSLKVVSLNQVSANAVLFSARDGERSVNLIIGAEHARHLAKVLLSVAEATA